MCSICVPASHVFHMHPRVANSAHMTEQTVTPWEVNATRSDGKMASIDYNHLITQFGCQKFTKAHEERLAEHVAPHRLIRRGLLFAHRDAESFLKCISEKAPFFLYTGRGPSSKSMHLGHSIPFILCKYLQEAFKVPLVVQITDDEKFLCKKMSLEEVRECALENIKDIIAYGFDPDLTYIFSNYESGHLFYANTLKVAKSINLNDACKIFGFSTSTNIGMIGFPASQIAAGFSTSYPFIPAKSLCLIPCAVDQDPYFRIARDVAGPLGENKPATLYVCLLPGLQGTNSKMGASDPRSAIYLSDDAKTIKKKVNAHAFSGGQETMEMHRELGGDPEVDVPFQYLRFFLEDDEELKALEKGYRAGTVGSGQMKKRCIEVVTAFIEEYQARRKAVTDEMLKHFMDISKFKTA